jgi:hypothetical protein
MMEHILFAGYTVQDAMLAAGIAIGLFFLVSILKIIFKKEEAKPYIQLATCSACGWQGQVSRHAGRCPGCNQALGDRLASRPGRGRGPSGGSLKNSRHPNPKD